MSAIPEYRDGPDSKWKPPFSHACSACMSECSYIFFGSLPASPDASGLTSHLRPEASMRQLALPCYMHAKQYLPNPTD